MNRAGTNVERADEIHLDELVEVEAVDAGSDDERRIEPRTDTAFFAVELRGRDLYYRLVRNISASGFSFDDRFPLERPGDPIVMEFPLPGSTEPIRIAGRVVYALSLIHISEPTRLLSISY